MNENTQAGSTPSDADSGQEESAVIRALRDEVKSLKTDLRDAKTRADSIAESTRSEMRRMSEAQKIVNDLGYPKMVEDVVEKVEGEVTVESVAAFLESRGLTLKSAEADSQVEAEGLAGVASLGQRVADAAGGAGPSGLSQRVDAEIAEAESPEQIAAIMAKAGLTHSR